MGTQKTAATSIDSLVREVAASPPIPVHDPVGETCGRYRIVGLIGKGGMGRVYDADDLELGRRVAIKFLPLEHAADSERVDRFVRERVVTADLEHPAIVPVYDSGVWESGEPFYVMREVHGESLDRRLKRAPDLPARLSFLGNVVAVADAIGFAHSRGVIHRDLKPANVLVGSFGETFVADWGLAKRLEDTTVPAEDTSQVQRGGGTHTRYGSVLGTPAYMAPEQRDGAAVDERADVFALGAILYEIVAGRPPPAIHGELSVPEMPAALGDLWAITRKSLSPKPEDRYPSAVDLALELHKLQAGQLVTARDYTWLDILSRGARKHRALVAVSSVATLVVLVVVVAGVARVVKERDVARAARITAEAATRDAVERGDALVLSQARAELTHDPTAALAWLKRYPTTAPRQDEVIAIAADAVARGAAYDVWSLGRDLSSAAFSPDSRTLAVAGVAGPLSLVDVASGARTDLPAPDGVGGHAVFSRDGRYLATSDGGETVRLWTVADGTSRRLEGNHVGGHHIEFSPDGTLLAVRHPGGGDVVWRVPSGERSPWPGVDALVAFLPGPARHAIVARGDSLEEVGIDTGEVFATSHLDGAPYDLALSGDGEWVAASRYDALVLWHPSTGSTKRMKADNVVVRVLSPPTRGHAFVSCGLLDEAWVFDAEAAAGHVFSRRERCTREAFSYSPSGDEFVSSGLGAELRIHEGEATRRLVGHDGAIADAAFSPDGRWLASASSDGTARLWSLDRGDLALPNPDTARGVEVASLGGISAHGLRLRGDADGRLSLATVGGDKTSITGPRPESVRWGALSADGRVVVAPDADGALLVWNVAGKTSRHLPRIDTQDARVPGVTRALASDGAVLAFADERGGVHVVDTQTGAQRALPKLTDKAFSVALSLDGKLLVAGTRDGEVRAWDVATGTTRTLLRIAAIVWSVAISRDGNRVAAAANDGGVYVLDADGGHETRLTGHLGTAGAVAFLADGRLLSGGTDGTIRLWQPGLDGGVVVRREPDTVELLSVSGDGDLVQSVTSTGLSIWKTDALPPDASDLAAFRTWAFRKTRASIDGKSARPQSK